MPSPSSSLATQRPDLQTFFQYDFMESSQYFISQRVFPVLPVPQQAGNFGVIPVEQLLQAAETRRAPGAGYSRRQFDFSPASYATAEHGTEEPVDDREARMYANYFDAEVLAASRARYTIQVEAEQRVADKLNDTTVYTGALAQAVQNGAWSVVTSTPITDVELAVQKMWTNCGLWANCLIMNRHTFRNLRNVTQIIDRIAASGAGDRVRAEDITVSMLSAVFDLPFVLVAGGTKNTATPNASAVFAEVWPNNATVCRIATTQDIREPCVGRSFHWSADGSQIDGTTETYREEGIRSNVVRVRHETDEKRLYNEAAILIPSVTA